MQLGIEDPHLFFSGFDHYRSGRVTKQGTGGPIVIIGYGRHFIASQQDNFFVLPVLISPLQISKPYTNPEHATSISKQKAFLIPQFSATIEAADGKIWSGVEVAKTTASTSSGRVLVLNNSSSTALVPNTEMPCSSPFRMRRSFIPTRVMIHSSEVSTMVDNSSLVRI